jgi:hypothetical protein
MARRGGLYPGGLMLWQSALRADCAVVLASRGRLRCRSQAALPSTATGGSGASFDAGHAIEERKGSRSEAQDAEHERRRIPGRGFASLGGQQALS